MDANNPIDPSHDNEIALPGQNVISPGSCRKRWDRVAIKKALTGMLSGASVATVMVVAIQSQNTSAQNQAPRPGGEPMLRDASTKGTTLASRLVPAAPQTQPAPTSAPTIRELRTDGEPASSRLVPATPTIQPSPTTAQTLQTRGTSVTSRLVAPEEATQPAPATMPTMQFTTSPGLPKMWKVIPPELDTQPAAQTQPATHPAAEPTTRPIAVPGGIGTTRLQTPPAAHA
jgi:hypothetical protein